ncbi:uncharacterized protein PAC_05028 [Phialocephala subalpina]|uniref:Carboxylesterase type B domain-containing protein n=1 Tax=Phialocephala subalpina TaxID=576137 RepID=A0A1L7WQU8_9HELO|nr:uncharacterized protein PAC_05028 [Phialocephala subalpina]
MASPPQTQTFTHPRLGPLTGLLSPSTPAVAHFRSIPYASTPARFRQSILLTSIPSAHSRDFTKYGTTCPCPPQMDQIEASGGPLEEEKERVYDEEGCLGLTIAVPTEVLSTGRELPVMVYVHGGGFTVGSSHVSALHDTRRLVESSIKEGHPVIIVSIHYRLNWFGFLACQDLLDEATSLNEAPMSFGIHDQRNAFLWIHRFIPGFGGTSSVSKITAFGESAGSASIALHMCSSLPLFGRAILMSGTPSTAPPVDLKYKEAEYRALLRYCGIEEGNGDGLEKLRSVKWERLLEAIGGVGIPIFRCDLMFSHLIHSLSHHVAKSNKKVYRYHQTIRNPFPGSGMHQIPGHHFIELLFLFGTLRERYPSQKLKDISDEYGKRWLKFAVGEASWPEYGAGESGEENIMIICGGEGFDLRTRREDELKSATASEGERRYKAWEVIEEVMGSLGEEKGEEVRMSWGPDGGFWRLAGLEGPYGVVLP